MKENGKTILFKVMEFTPKTKIKPFTKVSLVIGKSRGKANLSSILIKNIPTKVNSRTIKSMEKAQSSSRMNLFMRDNFETDSKMDMVLIKLKQ